MQEAIELARYGMEHNHGGPFGCVVVKNGLIIGKGNNRVLVDNDPTAHAEVVAIRDACKNLESFQLSGCELYTSCEPCPMCVGAIYWARPDKVYYAATRHDASSAGFDDSYIYTEIELPIANRKLVMETIGRSEAVRLLEQWRIKEDKTSY